ncbi:ABC transporter substrate-binding protein [Marinomonas sp. M1K-6]|uniref:ABC transporter substrate-binding protein n=1 Tax=Marinomonas profundi TaxID=2726122 RepID=A0A847QYH0_9GAMM|nr:ABC transporter substrate-binding protein [Marinomonas profundi]NLQ17999.1 ABC transporter substrate-binding protein [Marinomonas profundi]UDV01724.1 ABC transporter substrate-binding protein [Marinomonas profundi]
MKLGYVFCLGLMLFLSVAYANGAAQNASVVFPSVNELKGNQASTKSDVLLVHGALNRDSIAPLFQAYQEKYPQVTVAYFESNTRQLYEQFLSQPSSRPDIMISPAMDLQFKLANDGYALAYDSPELVNIPRDAHWRNELFGFTYEPIVTAINSDILVGEALPQSREQLLNLIRSKNHLLDDKIGLFDIQQSGLGYLAWAYDGQQARSYGRLLEAFGTHQARLYTDTSAMLNALLKGQIFIAYNLVGAYSYQWSQQYPWIKTIMPTDYTSVIMRTAFIARDTQQPKLAQRFIDLLLSPQGQQLLANQSGITPISPKAVGPYSRDELNKLPHGIFRPIPLGLELLIQTDEAQKQIIFTEWDNAMLSSP